jgi:hypothetical protein
MHMNFFLETRHKMLNLIYTQLCSGQKSLTSFLLNHDEMGTEMKTDIAKRYGGYAMTILIVSTFVLLVNLASTDFDGTAQSAMPTAALAFVVGLALASSMRWDRAMRYFRRTENTN